MHTPQPKIYDLAETSTFGIFRGRNVRGRNVQAEMSVAEMSVAEMSLIPFYDIFLVYCSFYDIYLSFGENKARPRGYKTFSMLNSPEHKIYPAYKC